MYQKDIIKNPLLKSFLSKVNFVLGLNPKVERTPDFRKYIPAPYKAVIIIQADFELAWAWRFAKNLKDASSEAERMGLLERENIPEILALCDKFKIPITWATVGHLFLKNCTRKNGNLHPEIKRLPNFENDYWKYSQAEWFYDDPCSDYLHSPGWYCPDLIDDILKSGVKHEIGCHTFSHIDCRDEICPPEVIESELKLCQDLASEKGLQLTSFVHPAHTIGNIKSLVKYGYSNFRTNYKNILGYPYYHPEGIWELKSTMDFFWRNEWSASYQISRYCRIIDRAVKNKSVCVFWFHPSMNKRFLKEVLPSIFQYMDKNKSVIKVSTSKDYIEYLGTRKAE